MMNDELREKLKYLRLTGLINHWNHILERANQSNLSPVRLLEYVIEEEYKIKKEHSRKLRLSRAKIPEHLVMETFPFHHQPNLNKKKLLSIYDAFDYMPKKQNLLWIGPTGTGKSGLATAFLIQAINQGYHGRFILFPDLIEFVQLLPVVLGFGIRGDGLHRLAPEIDVLLGAEHRLIREEGQVDEQWQADSEDSHDQEP